jgi:hypothetical protein
MRTSTLLLTVSALATSTVAAAQTAVGPEVRLDSGRAASACNETTMSAAASNPLEIVAGWNDYREGSPRTGVGLSLDGGETWTDFLLRPPAGFQAFTEGDPMTCADPRTGAIWAGGISFAGNGGIFCARKDQGASVFNPVVMANVGGGLDKGWMAAGPGHVNPSDTTRVYMAYNFGLQWSADMGDTWSAVVGLDSGLGFLPRVGPNGEVYVTYWDFSTGIMFMRSFDGGQTFGAPILAATRMDVWGIDGSRVPGEYRVASLNGLAVDPNDGALYLVYPDTTSVVSNGSNVDVYFTKSVDQGANWTVPVVINEDANPIPGDQFFPWLEADEDGRLHLLFYDTRNVVQDDDDPQGLIDAYYSYSDDGGANWTEVRLTAAPFTSADDGFGGLFIGDYLGMSTGGGRTLPNYMSTQNGDADTFTRVVKKGPAQGYCFGLRCPCLNDDPDAGCGNFGLDGDFSTGAILTASGTNSAGADDLVLTVSGIKANAPAIVYTSMNRMSFLFGDGLRCVQGPVKRFPVQKADAGGQVVFGPGGFVGPAGIQAGDTFHFQGWYRDNGGPCGGNFNLTNALSVDWVN